MYPLPRSKRTRTVPLRGFTLIEVLVTFAIFTIVTLIGLGSLISVIEGNRKSQAIKSVVNNLNIALENMTRNIRVGRTYHCEQDAVPVPPPSTLAVTQDCISGGALLSFESSRGRSSDLTDQHVYRFVNNRLERSTESGVAGTWIPITAEEVAIEDFQFYVRNTASPPLNTLQPTVTISIRGTVGATLKTQTEFSLQTTVTQRLLDI